MHVDGHGRAALHIGAVAVTGGFALGLDACQRVGQRLLGPLLQGQIQRQIAIFARLGLLHQIFRHQLSGDAVHLHRPDAVCAPEV